MNKFELTMRHTVAIVSYIAASMGYSKEEIKYIAGNMKFGSDDIGEFQEILAEPLDDIHSVKYNGEVKDLVGSFNLAERIQMVIDLILKKSNLEDGDDLPMKSYLSATVSAYKNSPFKFSNFIRNPKEEPGLTAHEEHLADEAIRKATEETLRELKGKEVEIPNFKPVPDVANSEEINEVNQAIESLIRLRNKLILNINEQNLNGQNKESQEPKEQPNINWDNVQKAQEQPKPFEPVEFTEEQRQRQREILGKQFDFKSRYDQVANEKVKKLSEYSIRHSTQHLFDEALRNRTEEEAMISRSIEIYPSTNLCKDSLNTGNFKNPSDFKGLFSFVRVDGDRLYRINDSSVQPWDRSKPLGTIRMISENFGLFTATKFIVKVNEDAVEEYVDEKLDNCFTILDAVNSKYGLSITPDEIRADLPFETPGQYLFRCSFYRLADEVKASLKESRNKFIKGLVRDSAIVVLNDKELYDWIKGENPTNS